MASANPLSDITKTVDDIRAGNMKPIYLLLGDEDYYIYLARKRIASALFSLRRQGVEEQYSGSDISVSQLIGKLNSPSLFEPFRIIVYRDAAFLNSRQETRDTRTIMEWIASSVSRLQSIPAILICTAQKTDKRIKLVKKIKSAGTILEFNQAKAFERGDTRKDPYYPPASEYLADAGKQITSDAWMMLRHRAANNLWAVINALESLIVYLDTRTRIESADVEEMVALGDDIPVFSLTEALGQKDAIKIRSHLDKLLTMGTPALMINKMLSGRIRTLLLAKSLLRRRDMRGWSESQEFWRFRQTVLPGIKTIIGDDPMLKRQLGSLHDYVLFLILKQSGTFTENALVRCIKELTCIDFALKSSTKSPQVLLEMALLPLCR